MRGQTRATVERGVGLHAGSSLGAVRDVDRDFTASCAQRAGRMRFAVTSSEQLLWLQLRGKQLGVSFRRQVPLGGRFIVDFLARGPRLVVEVDGGYHARRVAADARRDRALVRLGYRVLRLDAELVVRDTAAAVELVRAALAEAE